MEFVRGTSFWEGRNKMELRTTKSGKLVQLCSGAYSRMGQMGYGTQREILGKLNFEGSNVLEEK
jgi:hypothetical protein